MQKLNVTVDVVSSIAIMAAAALLIMGFQTDRTSVRSDQMVVTQDFPTNGDTWLATKD